VNKEEINEILYAVVADNLDNLEEVLDKLHKSRQSKGESQEALFAQQDKDGKQIDKQLEYRHRNDGLLINYTVDDICGGK